MFYSHEMLQLFALYIICTRQYILVLDPWIKTRTKVVHKNKIQDCLKAKSFMIKNKESQKLSSKFKKNFQ